MSVIDDYLTEVERQLRQVRESGTREAIGRAVVACADTIANDKIVFTFGTGHGSFAPLEMFPRTGTCSGFRAMIETPLSNLHNIFGDQGVNQYRYLHTQEGYGQAIMDAHDFLPGDSMVVFSQSGLNAVVIDIALTARHLGMTVIAVTSVAHSSRVEARHSSGLRLFEAADIVIDTGVPLGDASLHVDGLEPAIGPTSTVIATAVAHAIVSGTIEELHRRGTEPLVMVNINTSEAEDANSHNERVLADTWRRIRARP
jgi:uncharacterized phosphosugar-binding protein